MLDDAFEESLWVVNVEINKSQNLKDLVSTVNCDKLNHIKKVFLNYLYFYPSFTDNKYQNRR